MSNKTVKLELTENELEIIAHWIWKIRDNHRTDPWGQEDDYLADKLESAGFRLANPNYGE